LINRIFSRWFSVFIFLALLVSGCATAQTAVPARIIAIGDLHGDYDAFEAILFDEGLIDKRKRWSGGETILVQTGDVPDRGPDSLRIIEKLQDLQKRAARDGGRVITLVGNHEAMNVTGDLRYVHAGEYEAFADRKSEQRREATYLANREAIETFYLGQDSSLSSTAIKVKWFEATPIGKLEHQRAWAPNGDVGQWIAQNPAVAIVGNSLFAHGGISAEYTVHTLAIMNKMVSDALIARDTGPSSILYDELGPLWYRGNVYDQAQSQSNESDASNSVDEEGAPSRLSQLEEVNLALSTFDVDRIIIGHTPTLSGIKSTHNGKVIQIDTGIAAYYGGTQSYLEIRDGILIAHDNGVEKTITDDNGESTTP